MNNSDEELNIINTVLGFCESGDTHLEPETMLNPVTHYTDPDRLDQEIETLFSQVPNHRRSCWAIERCRSVLHA